METTLLNMSLFGACIVRTVGDQKVEITGAKHRALFVLLATAPFGRCTRSYLQDCLWGTACYDSGRQNLRRALSDIKRILNKSFYEVLTVNNAEITLDLSKVRFIGRPGTGEFLEGLDLKENGFNEWLQAMRLNPEHIRSLYGLSTQAPPSPIVPTLAILPFRLLHGTKEDEVLGDWLAEEISRVLSRSNLLAVISHLSTRELARRTIDLTQVRTALRADYCTSGSLRVDGETIILDADFLDAESGRILWTRQFTGKLRDFIGQDSEAIASVVGAIGRSIASEAIDASRRKHLRALASHIPLLAGVGLMHEQRLSNFAKSREFIRHAIEIAPRSAEAHAWLGEWYVMSISNGWSTNEAVDKKTARDHTARALDIDPENAFCLSIDGIVQNNLYQELDVAEDRFNKAIEINPNEAMSWLNKGALHAFRDGGVEAFSGGLKARRLSPLDPFSYFYDTLSATAFLANEDYERALELAQSSYRSNSRHVSTLRAKICALHNLGLQDEACSAAEELMRRQPRFTVESYIRSHPASRYKLGQRVAEALNAAGIP